MKDVIWGVCLAITIGFGIGIIIGSNLDVIITQKDLTAVHELCRDKEGIFTIEGNYNGSNIVRCKNGMEFDILTFGEPIK